MKRVWHIGGQIAVHLAPLILALCIFRYLGFAMWQSVLLAVLAAIAFWFFIWALVEMNDLDNG